MALSIAAFAFARLVTNVAAFAPPLKPGGALTGHLPCTDVIQSRPYPGNPMYTFEGDITLTAYLTVFSTHAIGPMGPGLATE